jgi:Flp pilus assembly protein TadG
VEFLTVRVGEDGSRLKHLLFWRRRLGKRGSFMLEFALVGPVFFAFLFMVFEISFDLFLQEVLDNSLQLTARQVQVGNTIADNSSNFVQNVFCANDGGLLNCGNVFVRVEQVSFGTASCQDWYDATNGNAPIVNGQIQLGYYYNGLGQAGLGGVNGVTTCDVGVHTYASAPSQSCMQMSAVYLAPSFLLGLLPHATTLYNGSVARAEYSTAAFVTEPFNGSTTGATC